jgi:glycosyltransferase involved in cell wall biosynthesis
VFDVDVIIPVLNEAEALPWLLPRLPEGARAIVVDNGSSDGSGDIAVSLGALVVREDRPGFGSACFAGLMAADREIVCFLDGDGSIDPANIPVVVDPIRANTVDLMLGARRPAKGAMTLHQRLANRVLAFELRRRTGAAMTDLGPLRAARRESLIALELRDRRSGWPLEMVLRASQANWRIAETGVPYEPRKGGQSKVTGTLKGTIRAVHDMSRLLADDTAR